VAGLLLVRAAARGRDLAVQAALGASRQRLIRQCLVEAGMLSVLGATAGVLIASWSVAVLSRIIAGTVPRADLIRVDPVLFGFTLLVALATGLLFGLIPALAASRGDLSQTLRDGGRSATAGAGNARLRSALVIGEIALASALLIGAGLFLRSFVNLVKLDPGFRADRVITGTIALPRMRYAKGEDRARFFSEFLDSVSRLPGVRSAGASTDVPFSGYDENSGFTVEGGPRDAKDGPHARYHAATPDYFRTLGIPLVAGRFFDDRDDPNAPKRILINASMARRYWPGQDAVGKRITFADKPKPEDWLTIVGVVGDVKDTPSANAAEPAFWWPHRQATFGEMLVAVRTDGDPDQMLNAIRAELARRDPELPLANARTMQQIAGSSRSGPRLVLLLTGIFSALALVLAAVGTYGVISYSVAQRRHEFGVRIALGARRGDLFRLVGGQGLRLAAAGIGIGMLLALALGRLLGSLLYGVGAADPLALGSSFVVALIVALAACFVPARRAANVDPMVSLRCE
jgi:predicted permease